jgi:plastocyanin
VLVALAAAGPVGAGTVEVAVGDGEGKPIPRVAVYARAIGGSNPSARVATATMDQHDERFVPHILVVQTGTAVQFPNNDHVSHHVYSFSPTKPFELGLYKGQVYPPIVFDKPGTVVLGCNIHDWMVGYIYVSESPYFGKTDASGTVQIADLPPRAYTVRVWHPQMEADEQTTRRDVDLARAKATTVAWTIALKPEIQVRRAPAAMQSGVRY